MFRGAQSKLEDCRILLERLRAARDAPSFRSLFNSFLSASRAITYALQKEGAHAPGFEDWYETKRLEMRSDDLLRFIHEARTEDFHEGKHRLRFSTDVHRFSQAAVGPRPSPDAKMVIGHEGVFWVVAEGTPQQRRIPIVQGGDWVTLISMASPPTTHRGKPVARRDPATICELAVRYFSELVHEAKSRFAS